MPCKKLDPRLLREAENMIDNIRLQLDMEPLYASRPKGHDLEARRFGASAHASANAFDGYSPTGGRRAAPSS